MSSQKSLTRRVVGLVLFVGIGLASGYVALNYRQPIIDNVKAYNYQPSSDVSSLRDDLQLTEKGLLYFDASETVLQTSEPFNESCQQQKETKNPILGCYYLQKIYVFNIDNEKLNGIEQTTAAHEVLHAAYERLSSGERNSVDKELKRVYESVRNKDLEERMAYYEKTEPGQEMNELHSILATEFKTLSPELEAHYKQYFKNRGAVVAFYEKYNTAFTSVLTKSDKLLEAIDSTITRINASIKKYNADRKSFESAISAYQSRTYTSQVESNRDFNALKARENELNARTATINASINEVNRLKKERNTLIGEYNELNMSINSSAKPTPSL